MTPCEKLGYKVGDRFIALDNNKWVGRSKGDILELVKDDGTNCLWFKNITKGGDLTVCHLRSIELFSYSGASLKPGDTIERDGKKYRVTFEEIPQYDFKPGMLCRVVWDGSESCGCRSNDDGVVFIQRKGKEYSEIAYAMDGGGTCVGYVKTSNLRPE